MVVRIGLIGFGKAGKSVASVFELDPKYSLEWIYNRTSQQENIKQFSADKTSIGDLLDQRPVDVIVDFSSGKGVFMYGEEAAMRGVNILSAVSHYTDAQQEYLQELSERTTVLWSPNITIGVNFLLFAAKQLNKLVPNIDIEIVEEHFKGKGETSGTAKRIASVLNVGEDKISSIRVGGIIGKHEIIFGFPYQTVRLIHEAISREAFGTGAAFIAEHLISLPFGLYSFEDILDKQFATID